MNDVYEVFSADDVGEWRVEYIDSTNGDRHVAIFIGPEARERAQEYADWKNGGCS